MHTIVGRGKDHSESIFVFVLQKQKMVDISVFFNSGGDYNDYSDDVDDDGDGGVFLIAWPAEVRDNREGSGDMWKVRASAPCWRLAKYCKQEE